MLSGVIPNGLNDKKNRNLKYLAGFIRPRI